jgi:hypothetical protein
MPVLNGLAESPCAANLFCHSELDSESRDFYFSWTPAEAGVTTFYETINIKPRLIPLPPNKEWPSQPVYPAKFFPDGRLHKPVDLQGRP